MLRKLAVAAIAVVSLSAVALASSAASAHGSGGHSGGFSPHASARMTMGSKQALGTRFIGPAVQKNSHRHNWRRGFSVAYIGAPYLNDGCYVTRRVMTPFGPRLRTVNVCRY